ncbi:E3 ubiquitin-protein ligase RING1-like [Apium graveolens]|uniref:E3 ubiquitin-protein ligase RING1-like n=1 Tax=Apium graveolens TaxID=4045 RepID=UPI003D7ACF09
MSSTATPMTTATQTYWCHECDMSVSLISTPSTPLCPYCRSDFIEHLDNNLDDDNNNNNNLSNPNPHFTSILPNSDSPTTHNHDNTFPNDNFLLDSPYLHRLIHQLNNNNATGDINVAPSFTCQHPTANSAIQAIPSIQITQSMIQLESVILCAVCKEHFVIHNQAKQLPCNHIYHEDCILPWLKSHNSCPVCRFKMPTENSPSGFKVRRRRDRLGNGRFTDFLGDDEFYGFGSTLRHIARRHRLVFPVSRREIGVEVVEESMLLSATGVAEAEIGVLDRENSVETVSSRCPPWPLDGEGGDQEVGPSGIQSDGSGAVL